MATRRKQGCIHFGNRNNVPSDSAIIRDGRCNNQCDEKDECFRLTKEESEKKTPTEIKQPSKSIPLKRRKQSFEKPADPVKPRDRQAMAVGLGKRTKDSLQRSDTIEKEIEKKTVDRQKRRSTVLQKQSEGESAYNRLTKIFQTAIRQAEDKSLEIKGDTISGPKDLVQELKFIARSRAVKETLKDVEKLQTFIQEEYKAELKYRKENKFPMAWMTKDKRINRTLDRYELLTPLLNYIFNSNRYTRGKDFDKMVALNDEVLNGEKYGEKDYNFSSFVTDQEFYDKLIKKFGKTRATWEKYIYALTDAEIILQGGRTKKKGGTTLYLDGYFMPYGDNGFRKVSFLKNNKEYREALRTFNIKW